MKVYSNALEVISEHFGATGRNKHLIANEIISLYGYSEKAFDTLCVAYAYMWSGAKYRREAISHFEKYLSHSANAEIPYQGITLWGIYSYLATLYEKEYEFEQAMQFLIAIKRLNCRSKTFHGILHHFSDKTKTLANLVFTGVL